MKFEPLYQLPNAWTFASGRFGVHLFDGEVTVEEMDEMERLAAAWHEDNPGRTVELVVIHPSRHRMTGDERRRMTDLMKRWEHVRDASSTVILAEGLLGAIHRSVLTGLILVVPPVHPAKVHADVTSALSFLAPYVEALGGPGDPAVLEQGVEALRRSFVDRPERR
jgi:hypothetical protein